MKSVAQRVAVAKSYVGKRTLSGRCEQFVRTCFGFPARYGSARIAWNNAGRRHGDINNAPAGVPIFWDLHPSHPLHRYGHVALSVGGGYCISTSVGAGKSIGKVRIADLTRSWGMSPLGWAEVYHGQVVYTQPKAITSSKPKAGVKRTGRPPGLPKDFRISVDGSFGFYTVWALQKKLRDAGFKDHAVDGVWGPATRRDYQRFLRAQGYKGHVADGDFGRASQSSERKWLRKIGYKTGLDKARGKTTIKALQSALLDGKVR